MYQIYKHATAHKSATLLPRKHSGNYNTIVLWKNILIWKTHVHSSYIIYCDKLHALLRDGLALSSLNWRLNWSLHTFQYGIPLTLPASPPAAVVWFSGICLPSSSPRASPPGRAPLQWAHLAGCGRSENGLLAGQDWSSRGRKRASTQTGLYMPDRAFCLATFIYPKYLKMIILFMQKFLISNISLNVMWNKILGCYPCQCFCDF